MCLPVVSGPNKHILVGGVIRDHHLPQDFEIIDCNFWLPGALRGRTPRTPDTLTFVRPLLVGHSAALASHGTVVILGGGATCFSMGTCWNRGPYTFKVDIAAESVDSLSYLQTMEIVPEVVKRNMTGTESEMATCPHITTIPELSLDSPEEFDKILRRGHPVVLKEVDLGSCVAKWTLDYLVQKVGAERKVCNYLFSEMLSTNTLYAL